MALFERYKLERDGNGYNVILYLDPSLAEFADEIGKNHEAEERLESSVRSFVKERFPNLRVHAAKIMIGSMLAASIPLGGAALAADVDAPTAINQEVNEQAQVGFKDVQGTKYESSVDMLQALGVISGFNDHTYRPDQNMTRAQFAKFAVYAAGYGSTAELLGNQNTGFTDVATNHWGSRYIQVAKNAGIMQGIGNNKFNPEAPVRYEEVVTTLQRIQGYKDDHMLGSYPTNHVIQATQQGITSNTDFKVGQQASRGNVAILLRNILEKNKVEFDSKTGSFSIVDENTTMLEKSFALKSGVIETDRYGDFLIAPEDGATISAENLDFTLVGAKGLSELLGHDVVFKKISNNKYLVIDKQDPNKIQAGTINATIDFKNGDATAKLQFKGSSARYEFASNPVFYKNGERLMDRPDTITEGQSVSIYLDQNNKVRYVNISDYKTPFVLGELIPPTDVLNGALTGTDKNGPVRYTIDKDRAPRVLRNGHVASLSDITKHDAVYAIINDAGMVTQIESYSNIVTGVVTKVKEGTGKYVQIDGKDYQLSDYVLPDSDDLVVVGDRDPEYIVGAKYSLILDKDGKVIQKFTPAGVDATKVTGMFLGADEVGKMEDNRIITYSAVKVLTSDGTEKTYLVSKDKGITSRVIEGAGDTFDLLFRAGDKDFTLSNQFDEPLGVGETSITADLLTLTLDDNGMVISIDPVLSESAKGATVYSGINKSVTNPTLTHATFGTDKDPVTYRYADNLIIYDQVNKRIISKDTFKENAKNYTVSYVVDGNGIYVNKIVVTAGVDKAAGLEPITGIFKGHFVAMGDDGKRHHYATLKIGHEERDFMVEDNFDFAALQDNALVTLTDKGNDGKYDASNVSTVTTVETFSDISTADRTFTINDTKYIADTDTQIYVLSKNRNGEDQLTLSDFSAIYAAGTNFDAENPNVKAALSTKVNKDGSTVKYGDYTALNSIVIDQR